MTGGGVAEKRPAGSVVNVSGEVHESIEARPTAAATAPPEPMDADADADGDEDADADGDEDADADGDEDADGEADPDMDADGEADVEMMDAAIEVAPGTSDDSKQAQAAAFRAKRDLLHLIETTAHYLSSYEEDGIEIAGGFQRIPNKRAIPDYFDIIKEPTAFSTIRGRIQKRVYVDFAQFVRDVALICHNAQVYNRPSAPIFQYAVKLRDVFKAKLQQLVQDGSIQPTEAELPYLGEIPDFSPSPPAEDDEEEEEDDDDDDEESDDDDDVDSETGRRRRRGPGAQKNRGKLNGGAMSTTMYTATEGRINAVIVGLEKAKDEDGDPLLDPFETLPDRELLPDYYEEIKNPIAIDIIKRKSRRKIYLTIDDAMADFDLMFSNAKLYNQDGSEIFEAAVKLQALARRLASQERAKPDNAFRDEHGRLAVPGVQHLGQVWRVGDWVLLRNANDPGKPIVAQIFRMWFDATGLAWVNACWYYRPEQTVHRHDRHFYENEVIKTEQYRDHLFDDVLDRTFVMFSEQYARGRPRGYPPNKTLYVCEYRYSEDTHRFTKITKWEPCVPEEVRGLDILMDPYPAPRKFPKYPSPIKHLLDANARETDALPKPTWGNPNAPPMIGSVHRRPRLPNESPPPDPATLPPPPQNLTRDMQFDPSRRVSMPGAPPQGPQGFLQPGAMTEHPGQSPSPHASYAQQQFMPRPPPPGMQSAPMGSGGMPPNARIQPSPHHHPMQTIVAHSSPVLPPQQGSHLAPSPGPGGPMPGGSPHLLPHNSYNNASASPHQQQLRQGPPTPVQHNQMMVPPPQQLPHHLSPQPRHPGMVPPAPGGYNQHFPPQQQPHQQPQQQQHRMPSTPMQAPTPPVRQTPIMPPVPPHQPHQPQQQQHHHQPQTIAPPPVPNGYIPPRASGEAFVLPESVDSTIPEELRKHYHRDDKGRVLFFTVPSVGHAPSSAQTGGGPADNVRVAPEYAGLGHSVRYLNGLEPFREERRLKRKARDEQLAAEQKEAAAQQAAEHEAATAQLCNAAGEALGGFVQWMNDGTRLVFEGEAGIGGSERKKQATTV